jgi:hypothetical protein
MRRVLFAFFGFPPLLFVALAAGVRLFGVTREPFNYLTVAGVGVWFVLGMYHLLVIVVLPLFLIAIWRNWLQLWHFILGGATAGIVLASASTWGVLFDTKLHLHYRLEQLASTYPFAVVGSVAAAVFWLLAIWRNARVLQGATDSRTQRRPPMNAT